jgi:hypothetical protein
MKALTSEEDLPPSPLVSFQIPPPANPARLTDSLTPGRQLSFLVTLQDFLSMVIYFIWFPVTSSICSLASE